MLFFLGGGVVLALVGGGLLVLSFLYPDRLNAQVISVVFKDERMDDEFGQMIRNRMRWVLRIVPLGMIIVGVGWIALSVS